MIIFVEGDEIINTTFVIFCMFGFIACNDQDQNETEEQVFLKKLSGQEWSAMAVAVDGKDVTSSFEGLSVRFTETGTYSVANAVAPIWSSAGAFELQPPQPDFPSCVMMVYLSRSGRLKKNTSFFPFNIRLTYREGGFIVSVAFIRSISNKWYLCRSWSSFDCGVV